MNNDDYVAALERELEDARRVKPGGQQPRADRIEAIEAEIARARGGRRRRSEPVVETTFAEPAPEDADAPKPRSRSRSKMPRDE